MAAAEIPTIVNLINAQPVAPEHPLRYRDLVRPLDGVVTDRVAISSPADVDKAVQASKAVFAVWSQVPIKERCRLLFKLHEVIDRHAEDLIHGIMREHGKTYNESKGEVDKANEVIEYAASSPQICQGKILDVSKGVTCQDRREPLGVVCSITPFNFPFMVPCWTIPIALAMGNTVILKPSEKVPHSAQSLVQLLKEAGFPDGVLNVVNGEREVVEAICAHPDIKAVTFVGSSNVARIVYTACGVQKKVTCMGGAKNHLVAVSDCDLEMTSTDVVNSFSGCAGERCMAASVLLIVGDGASLMRRICEKARAIVPGQAAGQMGPMIDAELRDRVLRYINESERAGAKVLVDGRSWATRAGFWVGPTILEFPHANFPAVKEEIFGPVLSVVHVATNEEALRIENANPYGNAACIYTSSGETAEWFNHRFEAGMIGCNIGVPVPREPFSFGGWNDSRFGSTDITGDGMIEFMTRRRKITTKWTVPAKRTWMD